MTTINDITDLIRLLREDPTWTETLRNLLLTKELVELPETLSAFVTETRGNFRTVNQRLESLEAGQAEMQANITTLQAGQAEMQANITTLQAGQAEMQANITTLQAGQAEMQANITTLQTGQATLQANITTLQTGQATLQANITTLQEGQATMGGDLSRLSGRDYETRAARRAPSLAADHFNLTRIETLFTTKNPERLDALALISQLQGVITPTENQEVTSADLVLRGEGPETSDFQLLAEISITVQEKDRARAVHRAAILERVTGIRTKPILIGTVIEDGLDIGDILFLQVPDIG